MLHITVACYFSTPNLIYTPMPKAQTLNLAPFLKAQALNLAPFLKAQALNLAPLLKAQALNLALFFKVQALNLAPFLKAQALNLTLLLKAQALNLALYLKNPSFKPGTYAIHLPYFQTQAFKNSEISNQLTILSNKELCNPVSPSLMEIRRSKVKPYRAP